jgi:glyceraldehyde 3-phosphate dehydrogenase
MKKILNKVRVGINGFGRIGRLFLREAIKYSDIEVVAINDIKPVRDLVYLLKYDSVHGQLPTVSLKENSIALAGRGIIPCLSLPDPEELDWDELGADYILETTGQFTNYLNAVKHLAAGARQVLIGAPTKDHEKIPTLIFGVNHHQFNSKQHLIISAAGCTTNCLAPIVKILNDKFGLKSGMMMSVHAYTATQALVDGAADSKKKEQRRLRAAAENIVPATSSATKNIEIVLPELQGKLTGTALRVPIANVSAVDFTFSTTQATSYQHICEVIRDAAEGEFSHILGYTEDPVVSSDFRGDSHSAIFDASAGTELNSNFFKILAWYDNEYGYTCRLLDLIRFMATKNCSELKIGTL